VAGSIYSRGEWIPKRLARGYQRVQKDQLLAEIDTLISIGSSRKPAAGCASEKIWNI
jgi:hypothetical protein